MIANPYAPPTASLEMVGSPPPTFYIVSKRKFLLLFIATHGWYLLYWLHRNWTLYRSATGIKVLPMLRAILSVLFVYSLFSRIDRFIRASGRCYTWYPRVMALGFILAACADGMKIWLLDVHLQLGIGILSLVIQTGCLLHVQGAINFGEKDAEGLGNSTLTFANGVWITLGLCFWGVVAMGLLVNL